MIKDNQEINEVSMKHMHDQFDMKINKFMDTMVMKSFMDWVTDSHIFAFAMFIS